MDRRDRRRRSDHPPPGDWRRAPEIPVGLPRPRSPPGPGGRGAPGRRHATAHGARMKRRRTALATKALVLQVASVLAIAAAVARPRHLALRAQLYAGVETSAESLLQVLEDML